MQLYICLAAFGSKYGSSTVASPLLQQTPVILRGPRHALSFLVLYLAPSHAALLSCPSTRVSRGMMQVTFGLVQGYDEIFKAVTEPGPCQFVVAVGAALYKVHKFTFVTLMGAADGWMLPILLAIVVLEGNSLLRSAENALSYVWLTACFSWALRALSESG